MSAKKAQRSAILKLLKTEVSPDSRVAQSADLCARVLQRIRMGVLPPPHHSAAGDGGERTTTVHVCSFLPLFFEPCLKAVARGLWTDNAAASAAQCQSATAYRVYVPRIAPMVPTSAADGTPAAPSNIMHFVEVLGEADLAASFVPQGRFGIEEILPSVWEAECASSAGGRGVLGHAPPSPPSFAGCLAPLSFAPPHTSHTSPHRHHVLLLCPSAAFDSACGRIGKGAGFYDRFLEGLAAQHHVSSASSVPASPTEVDASGSLCEWSYSTLGVGFDEQIVGAVAMEANDVYMDEVLTPSHHFVREGGASSTV